MLVEKDRTAAAIASTFLCSLLQWLDSLDFYFFQHLYKICTFPFRIRIFLIMIHEANKKVHVRHEYFFKYLQISPSYWLAHKKTILKEAVRKDELPDDFKKVLALYKLVGDVFTQTFDSWWKKTGQGLFADTNKQKKLWLSVDMTKSREQLIDDYVKLLDSLETNKTKPTAKTIQLQVNKIRTISLYQRHYLVTERAAYINNKVKKEKLWSIGKSIGIGSKWTKHIRLDSKRTATNAPTRNYLSILVSKNIKDALTLAENAARGKFPSLDPLTSSLKFDYQNIKKIQESQLRMLMASIFEFRDDKKKYMKLLDPSNNKIGRTLKLAVGVDLEAEYEEQLKQKIQRIRMKKVGLTEYEAMVEAEDALFKSRLGKP